MFSPCFSCLLVGVSLCRLHILWRVARVFGTLSCLVDIVGLLFATAIILFSCRSLGSCWLTLVVSSSGSFSGSWGSSSASSTFSAALPHVTCLFVNLITLEIDFSFGGDDGMLVVCLSEPLMRRMSSAAEVRVMVMFNWLSLFNFSVIGFMMYCKNTLNKSLLSGSSCWVSRLWWDCLLLTSMCSFAHCSS